MSKEYRHRIAMYADDMAADADTLEELFEIYKAIIAALDKAGIQIKASKVEFGVEEITFHNYRIVGGDGPMANTTTPKDETLDPIRSCSIPQSVTQLKAFLGSTQQMAQYVPYYPLIAALLHKLTRKERKNLPNRIQVDPGIRLRPCLPPCKKPHVGQAPLHLEQGQRASQLPRS